MKTQSLVLILMAFAVLSLSLTSAIPERAAQYASNKLEGTFDYVATYEAGSRAGTQTSGHRVTIETLPDGQYSLSWGDLKAAGARVGDGLIYRWQSGVISGEGIYIIYGHGDKLFGSFRLKDEKGEQRGYTQGTRTEKKIDLQKTSSEIKSRGFFPS
jgi:hypothetical protein